MTLDSLAWFFAGTLLPSLAVSWLTCFAVRRFAPEWGLVDQPCERKVHRTPTPLGGGLAIWLGVIVPFAVGQGVLIFAVPEVGRAVSPSGQPASAEVQNDGRANSPSYAWLPAFVRPHLAGLVQQSGWLWALLACATVLMLVGLADDRWNLDWRPRLAAQFIVAAVAVFALDWRLTLFFDLPLVTGLISILWIVGLTNSFNMLDNMDGLSAGVAAIAGGTLACVLLLATDPETGPQLFVAGFLLVLVGALVGFLFHNRPPAALFMGDAGSYFTGFCLSAATLLATYTSYSGGRPHAVLAPLCIMAVPLYDMISVILVRLREGRSPFQADKRHLSHRLVALGFSQEQAVLTIYLLTGACSLGAILLHRVDLVGAVVVVLLILSLLALIAIFENTAGQKEAGKEEAK